MSKRLANILKILISLCILVFVIFRYIDLQILYDNLPNISAWFFLAALLAHILYRWILAYQMKVYFLPYQLTYSTFFIFKTQLISSLYAFILPGDLSAGVSWYLLSKDNKKGPDVAAVLIYLRLINLVMLVPFALAGLLFEPKLLEINFHYYFIAYSIFLLLVILPYYSAIINKLYRQIISFLIQQVTWGSWQEKAKSANQKLWDAIDATRQIKPATHLKTYLLSLLVQIVMIGFTYLTLKTAGIDIPIAFTAILTAVLVIIYLLPISFSGLGIRELSLIYLLSFFYKIQAEQALISSMVNLVIAIMAGGILGGYYHSTMKSKT